MNVIIKTLGYIATKIVNLSSFYKSQIFNNLTGGRIGANSIVAGYSNIVVTPPVNIGPNSCIYTTRAKLIFKGHFISGPGLTIITGDHHYAPGRFLDSFTDAEKSPDDDKDVIIEEDVWCGANVTILKGVTIGRGSIIAAGAVVTKDIPAYTIAAGVPAKVIRPKFNKEQITKHENILFK